MKDRKGNEVRVGDRVIFRAFKFDKNRCGSIKKISDVEGVCKCECVCDSVGPSRPMWMGPCEIELVKPEEKSNG
jgi:hypothetical protein